ncbi:MAG: hypothetical protein M1825_002598 [Sarcosagium campestre]|nr:MAG: hypothetical protein M1825_002598 [Sarcosagium campestre]
MIDKILISFVVTDLIFLGTGILFVAEAVMFMNEMAAEPTLETVARDLLLQQTPVKGVIANAVFIFITFFLSLPALVLPTTRTWLRVHGWAVVMCATFTLVLGLNIWYHTLKTRSNLGYMWGQQPARTQSLLQQRFTCCGYLDAANPPFQKDSTCPNALIAAQQVGCVGFFYDFANGYLNAIFTVFFGIVALDVVLLLNVAMVLKDRREKRRYSHIDRKTGLRAI